MKKYLSKHKNTFNNEMCGNICVVPYKKGLEQVCDLGIFCKNWETIRIFAIGNGSVHWEMVQVVVVDIPLFIYFKLGV
jgi:hypothetical protein